MNAWIVTSSVPNEPVFLMGWDPDCAGALRFTDDGPVALFETPAAARQAIRISAAYAKLCEAQGRPVNTDFTSGRQQLRVQPCVSGPKTGAAK